MAASMTGVTRSPTTRRTGAGSVRNDTPAVAGTVDCMVMQRTMDRAPIDVKDLQPMGRPDSGLLRPRQLEAGGQLGLEAHHVPVEVRHEGPVLPVGRDLPEAGPPVGVLTARPGDGEGRVGLALVGDVV